MRNDRWCLNAKRGADVEKEIGREEERGISDAHGQTKQTLSKTVLKNISAFCVRFLL